MVKKKKTMYQPPVLVDVIPDQNFFLYRGRIFSNGAQYSTETKTLLNTYASIFHDHCLFKITSDGKETCEREFDEEVISYANGQPVTLKDSHVYFDDLVFKLRIDNQVHKEKDVPIDVFVNKFVFMITDHSNNRIKVFQRDTAKFLKTIPVNRPTQIFFADAKHVHVLSNNSVYQIFDRHTNKILLSWILPQPLTQITSNGKDVFLLGFDLHHQQSTLLHYQLSWELVQDPKVRTMNKKTPQQTSSTPITSVWNKL
jgi:hypothetical protein